jgi:hypothetical protein
MKNARTDELDADDLAALVREERQVLGLAAQRKQDALADEAREVLDEQGVRGALVKADLAFTPLLDPPARLHVSPRPAR